MILMGMMVLGTRTATIGAIVMPVLVFIALRSSLSAETRLTRARSLIVSIAGVVLIAVVGWSAVNTVRSEEYLLQRYQRLAAGQITRVVALEGAPTYLGDRDAPLTVLFGEGADRYQKGMAASMRRPKEKYGAEIDWLDLYGAHGAVFSLLLYAFYAITMLRGSRARVDGLPGSGRLIVVVLGVYLGHGFLAGHALSSPLPMGLVAPLLSMGWVRTWSSHEGR